ncbi:hypothetical protein B0T17DRAFT_638482 [Bombardia bombarda]|uniref:Uncharacterized protein n=1 Tax=Bombardia bombarda TaxID=252184 RepID=A0AA40C561_9PEZI|nr:hypothetical protein B0T17DRAFT_638482 [Bombardia bombarda]
MSLCVEMSPVAHAASSSLPSPFPTTTVRMWATGRICATSFHCQRDESKQQMFAEIVHKIGEATRPISSPLAPFSSSCQAAAVNCLIDCTCSRLINMIDLGRLRTSGRHTKGHTYEVWAVPSYLSTFIWYAFCAACVDNRSGEGTSCRYDPQGDHSLRYATQAQEPTLDDEPGSRRRTIPTYRMSEPPKPLSCVSHVYNAAASGYFRPWHFGLCLRRHRTRSGSPSRTTSTPINSNRTFPLLQQKRENCPFPAFVALGMGTCNVPPACSPHSAAFSLESCPSRPAGLGLHSLLLLYGILLLDRKALLRYPAFVEQQPVQFFLDSQTATVSRRANLAGLPAYLKGWLVTPTGGNASSAYM